MKSTKLLTAMAASLLLLSPLSLSETVSESINLTADLQVQPSVALTINSDLTASVDGTESGTAAYFEGDDGTLGATGCLTAPPGSINVTLDSANASSAGHFGLQSAGLTSKIQYVPSIKLMQTGGSLANVYFSGFSGVTEIIDLSPYDVDETDCSSKPANLRVSAYMNVQSDFTGDGAGLLAVIDAESLADGQLYTFSDTLTVTVEPVL